MTSVLLYNAYGGTCIHIITYIPQRKGGMFTFLIICKLTEKHVVLLFFLKIRI